MTQFAETETSPPHQLLTSRPVQFRIGNQQTVLGHFFENIRSDGSQLPLTVYETSRAGVLLDELNRRGHCHIEVAESAPDAMDGGIAVTVLPSPVASAPREDSQRILGFEWISSIPRLIVIVSGSSRKNKIGRELVERTLAALKAKKFTQVEVESAEGTEGFFEKMGFQIVSGLLRHSEGTVLRTFQRKL